HGERVLRHGSCQTLRTTANLITNYFCQRESTSAAAAIAHALPDFRYGRQLTAAFLRSPAIRRLEAFRGRGGLREGRDEDGDGNSRQPSWDSPLLGSESSGDSLQHDRNRPTNGVADRRVIAREGQQIVQCL